MERRKIFHTLNVTRNRNMIESAEEFLQLMRSKDSADYERFRNDEAPMHVWETLMREYPLANEWIARNRKSPIEVLRKLAKDERALVRSEVASVRRIPEDIQLLLAEDKEYVVRHSLVYNAKATKTTLEVLSRDTEQAISDKAKERLSNFGN